MGENSVKFETNDKIVPFFRMSVLMILSTHLLTARKTFFLLHLKYIPIQEYKSSVEKN